MKNQHVSEERPVNVIEMDRDSLRAYDIDTVLKFQLKSDGKNSNVDNIIYFTITQDGDDYLPVTDYNITGNTVSFTLPPVENGRYYPQMMDNSGRVYSSSNTQYIDVVFSREQRIKEVFPTIRQSVIDKMSPIIKEYLMENSESFKGDTGPPGPEGPEGRRGRWGVQGHRGAQGPPGPEGPEGPPGAVDFEALTDTQIDMLKGETGPQGEPGPQGEVGEQGPKGDDGTVVFEELTPDQIEMLTPNIGFELTDEGDLYFVKEQ